MSISFSAGNFARFPSFLAAAFAFRPEFLARTAKESDEAGFLRLRESFAVHKAQHEDIAIQVILHDGGNQSVLFFKIELKVICHNFLPGIVSVKTKNPLARFAPAGLKSAANYLGLATPPRARFHVMVMAVMLPRHCHDVSKLMTSG